MSNANPNQTSDHPSFTFEVDPVRAEYWETIGYSDANAERLRRLGTHDATALLRLTDLTLELEGFRDDIDDPAEALGRFVAAATDFAAAAERYAVIQTTEVVCKVRPRRPGGPGLKPATWPGWINADDPHRRRRILTPIELGLIRLSALERSDLHTTLIGLGEASAGLSELAVITSANIDIERSAVVLPGTARVAARTMALPAWAAPAIIDTAKDYAGSDEPMLYGGDGDDKATLDTLSMNTGNVFRLAGLGADRSATFESVRNTIARQILDSAGTDAAVDFLGESNYERVLTKLAKRPAAPPRRR